LKTDDGDHRVYYDFGWPGCKKQDVSAIRSIVAELENTDAPIMVKAYGERSDDIGLSICDSAEYYIDVLDAPAATTTILGFCTIRKLPHRSCNSLDPVVLKSCLDELQGIKRGCYASLDMVEAECDADGAGKRMNECRSLYAVYLGDPSVCGGIPNSLARTNCYQEVAIVLGKYSVCANIRLEGDQESCRQRVFTLHHGLDSCIDVTDRVARNHCYASVAKATDDIRGCTLMRSGRYNAWCYQQFGNKGNASVCLEVEDEERRGYCLTLVGEKTHDLSVCKMIEGRAWEARCTGEYVKFNLTEEVCDSIEGVPKDGSGSVLVPIKDDCYMKVAIRDNKPELCEKIWWVWDRRYCNRTAVAGEE